MSSEARSVQSQVQQEIGQAEAKRAELLKETQSALEDTHAASPP
jgi:hypothetical protein